LINKRRKNHLQREKEESLGGGNNKHEEGRGPQQIESERGNGDEQKNTAQTRGGKIIKKTKKKGNCKDDDPTQTGKKLRHLPCSNTTLCGGKGKKKEKGICCRINHPRVRSAIQKQEEPKKKEGNSLEKKFLEKVSWRNDGGSKKKPTDSVAGGGERESIFKKGGLERGGGGGGVPGEECKGRNLPKGGGGLRPRGKKPPGQKIDLLSNVKKREGGGAGRNTR